MVIAHSSGFDAAIKEVAPEFPDTQFALFSYATDTGGLKNYSAWSVDWDQVGYLQGVLGGLASKSGNIAVVGGEQIPSTKRTMDLATAGAQSVNKAAKVENVWIGSFVDVAKGRQVALQSINKGADFLIPIADLAGEGVKQAADESGALCLGEYIDESSNFPKSIVTSVTCRHGPGLRPDGQGTGGRHPVRARSRTSTPRPERSASRRSTTSPVPRCRRRPSRSSPASQTVRSRHPPSDTSTIPDRNQWRSTLCRLPHRLD